jgi:mono/diheme cytochrome c family protein
MTRARFDGKGLRVVLGAATLLSFATVMPRAQAASAADAGPAKVVITPEAREAASQIFEERCSSCHGPKGRGDGPAAVNLKPRPRDFQNRRWQKSVSDAEIAKAIVYGGSSVGLSGEMAPNPDLETEPAIVGALVERVRKLAK